MSDFEDSCDVIMLATSEIDHYAKHSSALWADYCKRKGYKFFRYSERLVPDMHVNWSKIEMVRKHLAKSTAEIVVLVDADTYVCNPDFSIKDMLDQAYPKQILFSADTNMNGFFEKPLNPKAAIEYRERRLPNAGFIVMRRSGFAQQFFDDWLDLAQNDLSDLADLHPRNQRVLWKGLFFQNAEHIAVLNGEIRRVHSEKQLPRIRRRGAYVAHVRNPLSEDAANRLRKLWDTPRPRVLTKKPQAPKHRALRNEILTDVIEHIAYGPALLNLSSRWLYWRLSKKKQHEAPGVVVSLTCIPERIGKVHTCITSLLMQRTLPEKIVLYLVRRDYAGVEIPTQLKVLLNERFEIRFVDESVRSFNKIFFALQHFSSNTIVTCDDDKIYPTYWLDSLLRKSKGNPECVICVRSREIAIRSDSKVANYAEWNETNHDNPSLSVVPIGAGGILYPAGCLHEDVLDADLFRELCETSDDLWLKVMSLRKGTPCVQVEKVAEIYVSIPFWNGKRLSSFNISKGGNDQNLQNLITHFNLNLEAMLESKNTVV